MSRMPMQAWHTDGRPSNIQVRKASERKSTSKEKCIKSGQMASEQKWTDKYVLEAISYIYQLNRPGNDKSNVNKSYQHKWKTTIACNVTFTFCNGACWGSKKKKKVSNPTV
jgi:hypothetical protein